MGRKHYDGFVYAKYDCGSPKLWHSKRIFPFDNRYSKVAKGMMKFQAKQSSFRPYRWNSCRLFRPSVRSTHRRSGLVHACQWNFCVCPNASWKKIKQGKNEFSATRRPKSSRIRSACLKYRCENWSQEFRTWLHKRVIIYILWVVFMMCLFCRREIASKLKEIRRLHTVWRHDTLATQLILIPSLFLPRPKTFLDIMALTPVHHL